MHFTKPHVRTMHTKRRKISKNFNTFRQKQVINFQYSAYKSCKRIF